MGNHIRQSDSLGAVSIQGRIDEGTIAALAKSANLAGR